MEFERRRYNDEHINITPIVDMVFLLLLFFMLTSHLVEEPVIKIKLPESKTAESQKDAIKTVFISKEGTIYFMNRVVELKELQSAVRATLGKDDFVRIKADKESDVGILVSVIDEIRLAGVKNYSIVTERR